MVKVFVTGDNHIGLKFNRYPLIKHILQQSRLDVLHEMVAGAEDAKCDLFVVTGDLFDNNYSISNAEILSVVSILAEFSGTVVVLPGNHDFYTGEEKLWASFLKAAQTANNIVLLNELRTYELSVGNEQVCIYPACCQAKRAKKNNLNWIKKISSFDSDKYHIGIAHGAIRGITPDLKQEYFLMTEGELQAIPVDVWLIGHTHVPYPNSLSGKTVSGRIYNAGTHEQTDLANNTRGYGIVVTMEKNRGNSIVSGQYKAFGHVRYYDINIPVSPGQNLRDAIRKRLDEVKWPQDQTILRLNLSGSVRTTDYEDRVSILDELGNNYLACEWNDRDLAIEITEERIREEFPEISFAAQFLTRLLDDPTEVQMAYDILQQNREKTGVAK